MPAPSIPFRVDAAWLERYKPKPASPEACCSKCRRGTKAHGLHPCGYPQGCPNPDCAHHKKDE